MIGLFSGCPGRPARERNGAPAVPGPPVSRVLLQVKPKSFRSIVVEALKPARVIPIMSVMLPLCSSSRTTCLVTPRMVRSPCRSYPPRLPSSTLVDLKLMVGKFSTSRKSGLRRCPSRLSLAVLIDAASMLASTAQLSGSSGAKSMLASNSSKLPETLLITMCFTLKVILVWLLSSS